MILDRLFRKEEINGHDACPTYLYRWTLLRVAGFAVYLHHFVADDWSRDLHDHPRRFWSIGLKGRYMEETPEVRWPQRTKSEVRFEVFDAPWFRSFPAEHRHRIVMPAGEDCWTLVIVGRKSREWGFWHTDRTERQPYFVPWNLYVQDPYMVNEVKTCR